MKSNTFHQYLIFLETFERQRSCISMNTFVGICVFRIRRRVFPQPPISVRVCNQGTAAEGGGSKFSVTALLTETIRLGQRRFWRGVYSARQDLQNLSRDFIEALHLSVIFSLAFSKSELPKFKMGSCRMTFTFHHFSALKPF